MVPGKGLEPLLPRGEPDFESGASANSATRAEDMPAREPTRRKEGKKIQPLPTQPGFRAQERSSFGSGPESGTP